MLSKYEREALKRAMHPELEARPGSLTRCATGILAIVALAIAGPVAQLHAAGQPASCVLERLVGIAE